MEALVLDRRAGPARPRARVLLFGPQLGWLRGQLTAPRLSDAHGRATSGRALVDLLQIAKDGYGSVLDSIAALDFEELDDGDLRDVTEVLSERRDADGMATLCAADPRWHDSLDPRLAVLGDASAQRRELQRLTTRLQSSNPNQIDWQHNWLREIGILRWCMS